MTGRLLRTLPLLVVTMLVAWSTGEPAIAVVVVVGAAVALPLAPWLDPQPLVQRLTLAAVAIVAASGGAAVFVGPDVDGTSRPSHVLGVFAATAVLLVLARRFFLAPEGDEKPDVALLTVAILACGQKHVGVAFDAAVVSFLGAIVLIIRSRDSRIGWSVVERNAPRAVLGMAAVTVASAAAALFGLPRLSDLTHRQFDHFIVPLETSHTGFTDRLRPGLADPLLESDTLVLRVFGPHTDYLRGRVYDRYDRGAWEATLEGPLQRLSAGGRAGASGLTQIRTVSPTAVPASLARYFVPLGARSLATSGGYVLADSVGTLRPDAEPPTSVSFEYGEAEFPVAPAGAGDLLLPDNLVAPLRELAATWTLGATRPVDKLAAIERHLHQDFTYSLEPDESAHHEPAILHFLLHSRKGHCEYFATAMALLARAAGVPARAVGGYRVSEHNRIGGYDVVREKNAHAWVEAWLPVGDKQGWRTVDPTPVTEANTPRDERTAAALADAVMATWDQVLDAIGRAKPWQFAVGLAVAIGLLVLVRAVRARRGARGDTVEDAREAPLAAFARLEEALAGLGQPRPRSEPLEAYAVRLEEARYVEAAQVVLSYGALRYGGIGDIDEIARHLDACAKDLAFQLK